MHSEKSINHVNFVSSKHNQNGDVDRKFPPDVGNKTNNPLTQINPAYIINKSNLLI